MAADATVNRMWPVYTPDGTGILYEQRGVDSDQSDIYLYDIGTATAAPLLATAFDEGAPTMSPDGTTILFHTNRSGAKYDIWAMNADGTNQRAVTQTSRSDGYPIWSPDGASVGFVRDRELWTMVWTDVEDDRDYRRLTRRYE
jgi:TolB protein